MSITAPLLNDNLTVLPPEVVRALKAIPSSTLVYEIEEGGKVLISVKPRRAPKTKPGSNRRTSAAPAQVTGNFPTSREKINSGRMEQLLKIAATFPGLKPGVKPATIEELNEVIAQRAVARYERSLK